MTLSRRSPLLKTVLTASLLLAILTPNLALKANAFPAQSATQPAAERPDSYLPLLQGKRVGLVVNQTSRVGAQHLLDYLRAQGIQIQRVFAPEHGLRGQADAGAEIQNGRDAQTGLPVFSLYGDQKKPPAESLQDLDLLLFDIQDVGVRYYTYISTLHYVLEAAAEAQVPVLVLDRPNPNGDYVDGPMLEAPFRSFVGLDPLPLVHGLTVGELAQMIVGEGWLQSAQPPQLSVIPVAHYTHQTPYSLPVRPSPNLPNDRAIRLYPSLGLFEGTVVSVGRGTPWPFQILGLPPQWLNPQKLSAPQLHFTPRSGPGAHAPPYQDRNCLGLDLRQSSESRTRFSLRYLLEFYRAYTGKENAKRPPFFKAYFEKLAGTAQLRQQIEAGWSEARIRASWQADLEAFRQRRRPYLLYPE